jgi:hypothetical protein
MIFICVLYSSQGFCQWMHEPSRNAEEDGRVLERARAQVAGGHDARGRLLVRRRFSRRDGSWCDTFMQQSEVFPRFAEVDG